MKVLWLAKADYGNSAYIYSECLKRVGIESSVLKYVLNPRRKEQAPLIESSAALNEAASAADVIIWAHTILVPLQIDLSNKILGVYH